MPQMTHFDKLLFCSRGNLERTFMMKETFQTK